MLLHSKLISLRGINKVITDKVISNEVISKQTTPGLNLKRTLSTCFLLHPVPNVVLQYADKIKIFRGKTLPDSKQLLQMRKVCENNALMMTILHLCSIINRYVLYIA